MAVFVDGCFWHACPKHATWPMNNDIWWADKLRANVERDRETDRLLQEAHWTVVRVWEHEPVEVAVESVVEALTHGRGR